MKRFLGFCWFYFISITFLSAKDEITCLFQDLKEINQINQKEQDHLPYHYNYVLMGGYFNMPSARVNEMGMMAFGFSYVPPYRNYGATIQPLKRLELGLNYRVFIDIPEPSMGNLGFGDDSDRGANMKFQVLRKDDGLAYFPEIAMGIEDFYGTKRFHSFYVVATKSFLDWNLETTIGWGKGRIKGFFGGLGWTPFRQLKHGFLKDLTFIGEYDAIDYKHHPFEHPKGRHIGSRINLGVSGNLLHVFAFNISYLRGKTMSASLSFARNLGTSQGLFPKIDNPPFYTSPLNLEPLGPRRQEKEFTSELVFALAEQKLSPSQMYLTTDENHKTLLYITLINRSYRSTVDLKERLISVLSSLIPNGIDKIFVNVESNGIVAYAFQFQASSLKRLRMQTISPFEFDVLTPLKSPITFLPNCYEGTLLYRKNKPLWKLTIRPRLLTFFGSATGKFKYSSGILVGSEGYLRNQFYYNIQGAYNAKSSLSDVGDMDQLNPSELFNVRSDLVNYYRTHSISLEKAYLQKGTYLGQGWYHRSAMGYFEIAFNGIANEFLYYPAGANWAIALEAATVLKRKYQGFKFTTKVRKFDGVKAKHPHFIGYQYFVDFFYSFKPLHLIFKISVGQFLARDKGARFEIGRTFASGLYFSLWYTWTNAYDIVNQSRYHDKGFALVIPFDFFLKKSSKAKIGYLLSVWLRDSGARASTGKRLYPTLYDERYSYLTSS